MAYTNTTEIAFASGYYHISSFGVVTFKEGTPKDMIERFWEVWPSFRQKVIALQRQGILDSRYPILPWEDPEENRKHYE